MSRARDLAAASLFAVVLAMAPSLPASAVDIVRERGGCDHGTSTWKLVTRQVDVSTLLVRVEITGGVAGHEWNMRVTDNGDMVIRNIKISGDGGLVRWARKTIDRVGTDVIEMAANNRDTGEICTGSLAFPQN